MLPQCGMCMYVCRRKICGPGDSGLVGKLKMSMHGTRDAAADWAAEYSSTIIKSGYQQGKSCPCIFYNGLTDTAIMVHGDDFVGVGRPEELAKVRNDLEEKHKLKVETLGTVPQTYVK